MKGLASVDTAPGGRALHMVEPSEVSCTLTLKWGSEKTRAQQFGACGTAMHHARRNKTAIKAGGCVFLLLVGVGDGDHAQPYIMPTPLVDVCSDAHPSRLPYVAQLSTHLGP
jgi:hypothetical protein